MGTKEIIILLAAILFLIIVLYTINEISKLTIRKSRKLVLYYFAAIIPILGLGMYSILKAK